MKYETVIGLEIHAQLLTRSKMFCGCSTRFGSDPNTQTCPVCTGMPGVLPVINRKAVEYVIKTGLVLNCSISPLSRFARKNYFYPDLPKGYQISQYEMPLCEHGLVEIRVDSGTKKIRLTRIHLEEDAGKTIHVDASRHRAGTGNQSLVDLNRAGTPLMEIVTEPDLRSAKEATEFMKKLRTILRYIDVCDGNMEQGSLRCDANVSVRPAGQNEFGVKTEIKNMNSFKFIEKALDYETRRQTKVLSGGDHIIQETRLWNEARGITESMRSKEEAHDYRYFPEPDLVPVEVDGSWRDHVRAGIGELPDSKRERFIHEYLVPESDADLLVSERSVAEWFEEGVRLGGDPRTVSNWIKGELMRFLNEKGLLIEECKLRPGNLVGLLKVVEGGTISGKMAKTVFEEMLRTGKEAATIVKEKGLVQITDEGTLETIIREVLEKNPAEVERFRSGEGKLLGFFVGQVMKQTKGKANPEMVNKLLKNKLS